MSLDPVTIAVFLLATALLGLAKGGVTGVGLLAMPLMLFVMGPVEAAGLMLPVLMIQDAFSVWLYRGLYDKGNLKLLVPASFVGVLIGFALLAYAPTEAIMTVLGAITLSFAVRGLLAPAAPPAPPRPILGASLGALAGFTSTVLHHGGPPFQMYLLPQKLPRDVLVSTTVVFFFLVNWIKLPGFLVLGSLNTGVLWVALAVAPFALFMTWCGRRVVRMIRPDRFYVFIYAMLTVVGMKLLWDGLA